MPKSQTAYECADRITLLHFCCLYVCLSCNRQCYLDTCLYQIKTHNTVQERRDCEELNCAGFGLLLLKARCRNCKKL